MRELVRDLLPDIYKDEGKEGFHFDAAIGSEFFEKLREKLVEHSQKYKENWKIEDLVGVYDCVLAILKKQDIDANEFRKKGMEIRMKEGGYDFGTVIDWDKSKKGE